MEARQRVDAIRYAALYWFARAFTVYVSRYVSFDTHIKHPCQYGYVIYFNVEHCRSVTAVLISGGPCIRPSAA